MKDIKNMTTEELEALLKEKRRKQSQLHNSQMAIKIAMNSLYGACANRYFLYYIPEMAEAITTSGQLSIRYAEKSVNTYLNSVMKTQNKDYIAYIDTDSIYVDLSSLIEKVFGKLDITREQGEKFLDEVCGTKLEKVISDGYEELAKKMGAYRNAMSMKREKITDKTIFIAKKRYIMNVLNSEGVQYTHPKISVTGVESVRSSTPEVCRKKMEEAFKIFLNEDEASAQKFIQKFRDEFKTLPASEIGKTSGTDDIEKFIEGGTYKKGTPIHVRGSILYNDFLRKKKLENTHETIRSGDKVKFVYLKIPNPIRENVISFPGQLPKDFGLEQYIDYDTQFDKVFLHPLSIVLKALNWSPEKVDTIEDFFS